MQTLSCAYRWFSWGVASLPEGKSQGLCLAQLCTIYRLLSATLSPYHCCLKTEEAASLKMKGSLYSCLLVVHLPSGSRTLNWNLETIYIYVKLITLTLWQRMSMTRQRVCQQPSYNDSHLVMMTQQHFITPYKSFQLWYELFFVYFNCVTAFEAL